MKRMQFGLLVACVTFAAEFVDELRPTHNRIADGPLSPNGVQLFRR